MKRLFAAMLSLFCLLSMVGCGKQPQQVNINQLIAEGNVINVKVSSLPEQYNYSFHGEDAKAIIDYLTNLSLESQFEEDPDVYAGMTWVISLEYDDGDVLNVYHFGNTFIRSEKGSWYKMNYDEASRFDTLLDELSE